MRRPAERRALCSSSTDHPVSTRGPECAGSRVANAVSHDVTDGAKLCAEPNVLQRRSSNRRGRSRNPNRQTLKSQVLTTLRRRGVVVGLSGGIDSSVVTSLGARAFGPDRVLALLMPERDSASESAALGRLLASAARRPDHSRGARSDPRPRPAATPDRTRPSAWSFRSTATAIASRSRCPSHPRRAIGSTCPS